MNPQEILGSWGITGNVAALIVGGYYGYLLWEKVHGQRKNGNSDALGREKAVTRVIERIDERGAEVKAEVGITRHALRNEMQSGFAAGHLRVEDLGDRIDAVGTMLGAKLDAVKDAILVTLPGMIRRG